MSAGQLYGGMTMCLMGAILAVPLGMAMGGFGMCAIDLTIGLVVGSAFVGAAVGGSVAALWRSMWWVGALSFSIPFCLALPLALMDGARAIGILICVVAAFSVAFLVRYPGPSSLNS